MNEITYQQPNSLSIIDSIEINSIQNTLTKINQLQQVVQSTLKPNHDYGVIPGTNKPTLLKPGAEKIHMLFGVTSEYEVEERIQDYEKGFFAFTVRCAVLKNGIKITEGVGHCNTKEKKYITQDAYTLANTCLKMAKKRAQIDATLTLASLSEIFTQDIEDLKGFAQSEQMETMTFADAENIKLSFGKNKGKTLKELFQNDKSYLEWLVKQDRTDPVIKQAINNLFQGEHQNGQQQTNQQSQNSGPCSDNQIKAIYGSGKRKGIEADEVKALAKKIHNVESLKDLTFDQASAMITLFNDTDGAELKAMFGGQAQGENPFQGEGQNFDISDDDLPFDQ